MPNKATPLQRAQLLAALSVGSELIRLRQLTRELDLGAEFDPVLASVAQGDSAGAGAHLAWLDAALAARTTSRICSPARYMSETRTYGTPRASMR